VWSPREFKTGARSKEAVPLYKYISNRGLVFIENSLIQEKTSEDHTPPTGAGAAPCWRGSREIRVRSTENGSRFPAGALGPGHASVSCQCAGGKTAAGLAGTTDSAAFE
jgi:hypothetical protein